MFKNLLTFSFLALVGGALADRFNITLGDQTLFASDVLNIDYTNPTISVCASNCTTAQSVISACNEDVTCLCSNTTVPLVLSCQQCMFTSLIALNKPMPDPRAGSTPLLQGYATACLDTGNITVKTVEVALTLPANWDGPSAIFVPIGGLVITVGAGAFLSLSAILILSNL